MSQTAATVNYEEHNFYNYSWNKNWELPRRDEFFLFPDPSDYDTPLLDRIFNTSNHMYLQEKWNTMLPNPFVDVLAVAVNNSTTSFVPSHPDSFSIGDTLMFMTGEHCLVTNITTADGTTTLTVTRGIDGTSGASHEVTEQYVIGNNRRITNYERTLRPQQIARTPSLKTNYAQTMNMDDKWDVASLAIQARMNDIMFYTRKGDEWATRIAEFKKKFQWDCIYGIPRAPVESTSGGVMGGLLYWIESNILSLASDSILTIENIMTMYSKIYEKHGKADTLICNYKTQRAMSSSWGDNVIDKRTDTVMGRKLNRFLAFDGNMIDVMGLTDVPDNLLIMGDLSKFKVGQVDGMEFTIVKDPRTTTKDWIQLTYEGTVNARMENEHKNFCKGSQTWGGLVSSDGLTTDSYWTENGPTEA